MIITIIIFSHPHPNHRHYHQYHYHHPHHHTGNTAIPLNAHIYTYYKQTRSIIASNIISFPIWSDMEVDLGRVETTYYKHHHILSS